VRGGDVVVVLAATAQPSQTAEAIAMFAQGIESGNLSDRRSDRSFIIVIVIIFV
jgi:hypothetical protein